MFAEIVGHFCPKLVELHNYSSASGKKQKEYNWGTLNLKVLKKLKWQMTETDI